VNIREIKIQNINGTHEILVRVNMKWIVVCTGTASLGAAHVLDYDYLANLVNNAEKDNNVNIVDNTCKTCD